MLSVLLNFFKMTIGLAQADNYKITIKQIGKFGWFSPKATTGKYKSVLDALKAHYEYISSKAEIVAGNFNSFLAKAKEELKRLANPRVGLKFFIAVPKDWTPEEAIAKVKGYVMKKFSIVEDNLILAFHSHEENPHVHVLVFPERADGRKLRIQPRDLKSFNDDWEKELLKEGYRIFKLPESLKKVPIWIVKKYPELYEEYRQLLAEYKKMFLAELETEIVESREAEENLTPPPASAGLRVQEEGERDKQPFPQVPPQPQPKEGEMKLYEAQLKEIEKQLKGLGFGDEAKICVVAVKEGEPVVQRIIYARKLKDIEFLRFLRQLNAKGYNIYISINELKPEATDRKKESFKEEQRHIYLDIDGDKLGRDGLEILKEILRKEELPLPSLVVRTSKRNYQAVWTLAGPLSWEKIEAINRELARRYGLDPAVDVSRVFRLAGFFNRKANKGDFVYVSFLSSLREVDAKVFSKYITNINKATPEAVKLSEVVRSEPKAETVKPKEIRDKIAEIDEVVRETAETYGDFQIVEAWEREKLILEKLKGTQAYELALHHKTLFFELFLSVASHLLEQKGVAEADEFIGRNLDKVKYVIGEASHSLEKLRRWSYSEAEASAIYLTLKAIATYKGQLDKELVEVVRNSFRQFLEAERPDKLRKNPKYADISINNVVEQLRQELGEDEDWDNYLNLPSPFR